MVKNHTFRFRVTQPQFEQIKNEAQAKGYVKVAPYLRDLALEKSKFLEDKIINTHEKVTQILEVLQNGRKV